MLKKIKIVIAVAILLCIGHNSSAQMKGDHLLGDYGLAAGTQPPPGIAIAVPVYDYYSTKFIDNHGNKTGGLNVNAFLLGIGCSVVTNFKILHANYGASLLFAFASNKLEGGQVNTKSSFAFSDTYVQPLQLGWHIKQADFTIGYGLYIPTGRYEFGGDDNSGMGMWTNEFSAGSTVYFDKEKTWNLSTIVFYEIHSKKKGTEMKVGDILTLEGGFAKSFLIHRTKPSAMEINVGAVYYAQFKLTNDKIPVNNQVFTGNKDLIGGLGLEANVLFLKTFTSLSLRWVTEVGARNRLEGNTFLVTIGQFFDPFKKKHK